MIGALALAGAPSCAADAPVVPVAPTALVGDWVSARDSLGGQGGGSWQRALSVAADGRAVRRGVSFGLYPGQGPNDVSAESVIYGRLHASARAFVLVADSLVTRDRFTGTFTRTVQRDELPRPDSIEYAVRGDVLELTFLTYPADAPVVTRETLTRRR